MTENPSKARALLAAAHAVLAEGAARADRFKDGDTFRRALVKALEAHPGFGDAAQAVHAQARSLRHPERGQVARAVVPAGRVQAPRHDTPLGRTSRSKRK